MKLFGIEKPVIGMIHIGALPGTPKYLGSCRAIVDAALVDLQEYLSGDIDVLMIENMHDIPYLKRTVGPEIVSTMTMLLCEIKKHTNKPIGLQILAGANKAALACALASGADFIRAEGFVFGHIADEGYFDSDAGELLRYRKQIGGESVKVFTDIKKKHSSHSITSDVDIAETAKAAEYFLSDGVIVTGTSTGKEPSLKEIAEVKGNVKIPVIAGSGVTIDNVEQYYNSCDALIVGSYFKQDGHWESVVDGKKVGEFMAEIKKLRK